MRKWLVPVLFTLAIVLVVFFAVRAVSSSNNDAKPEDTASPTTSLNSDQKAALREGQSSGNSQSPKVVVTEFGDLQCPACKLFEPALEAIRTQYKDQVQVVWKHFPLYPSPHKNAMNAAYASEAAANQGKFWDMHDKLYDTQDDWAELDNPKAKFVDYARTLGLNESQFSRDYDGEAGKAAIGRDKDLAGQLKLKGTPSIFVNDVAFDTTQGADALKSQVEALLK